MTGSYVAGSPIPVMTRSCRFVIATMPIGAGGEAPSGLRSGEARELAAVGAPAAVGLALHGVEGQPAAAFGVGKAHGLHELSADEERRFEGDASGPVDDGVGAADHVHEGLGVAEGGADAGGREGEGAGGVVAAEGVELRFD